MEFADDAGTRYAGDGEELPGAGQCGSAEESSDRFTGGSLAVVDQSIDYLIKILSAIKILGVAKVSVIRDNQ